MLKRLPQTSVPVTPAPTVGLDANTPPSTKRSVIHRLLNRVGPLFWITVMCPTLGGGVYFGLFASDVYTSEARFLVRSPQRPATGGLGALLQGTMFSRAQDDTYSVHDYIRSRDALGELEDKVGIRAAYSHSEVDLLNRFPGLDWDDSFEALHRYYQKRVSIVYDSVSSISILRVQAFSAAEAKRINELLIEMSERLLNNMNMRSRRDLIEVAEGEVLRAELRARESAAALSAFRADRGVLDPDRQGALQLQGVLKLREELLIAEGQLAQVRQLSPENPQIPTLEGRVQSIQRSISDENNRVLGRSAGLVAKSPQFDRLVLEKGFADRQLAAALVSLDQARAEAQRKQLYLERLVQPNLPDKAAEPRRLRTVLMIFCFGLIFWAVTSLVVASVREHSS
jgi:capsular polysaccharide transport system permease protein